MVAVHIVIALALIQFMFFGILVGNARAKYQIKAPAVTGNEIFERYYRVQYNTLEQLAVFIPSILLFGAYVNAPVAAGLGLIYLVGRFVYLRLYVSDPDKRTAGFGLSVLPIFVLVLGGLGGAIWRALGAA